jgi:hypothetical protein
VAQGSRKVLLDFSVSDTEPAEMRLVIRQLEKLVLVFDGDVAGPLA